MNEPSSDELGIPPELMEFESMLQGISAEQLNDDDTESCVRDRILVELGRSLGLRSTNVRRWKIATGILAAAALVLASANLATVMQHDPSALQRELTSDGSSIETSENIAKSNRSVSGGWQDLIDSWRNEEPDDDYIAFLESRAPQLNRSPSQRSETTNDPEERDPS